MTSAGVMSQSGARRERAARGEYRRARHPIFLCMCSWCLCFASACQLLAPFDDSGLIPVNDASDAEGRIDAPDGDADTDADADTHADADADTDTDGGVDADRDGDRDVVGDTETDVDVDAEQSLCDGGSGSCSITHPIGLDATTVQAAGCPWFGHELEDERIEDDERWDTSSCRFASENTTTCFVDVGAVRFCVLTVRSFFVPEDASLTLTGSYPLAIVSELAVVIHGEIHLSAEEQRAGAGGFAGGGENEPGQGPNPGLAGTAPCVGGGGGGNYGCGGRGGCNLLSSGGAGTTVCRIADLHAGSGGGGGGGPGNVGQGGAGAGMLRLFSGAGISLAGERGLIHAIGGHGAAGNPGGTGCAGGGGGGAGGTVVLEANRITLDGLVDVLGGDGGNAQCNAMGSSVEGGLHNNNHLCGHPGTCEADCHLMRVGDSSSGGGGAGGAGLALFRSCFFSGEGFVIPRESRVVRDF